MSRSHIWQLSALGLAIALFVFLPPTAGASPPTQTGPWTGWYYNGVLASETCFSPPGTWSRTDPAINFYWHEGTSPWAGALGAENYTVCWQGWFNFPASGNYTFYTFHDDGIRVWVPDLGQPLMVDAWYDTGPSPNQGTWFVPAGWHRVVVAYYNHTNAGVACVDWAQEGAPNPLSCPYFPPTNPPPPVPVPPPNTVIVINNIINNYVQPYAAPRPAPAPYCFWYRVQWGDNLYGIAWRFGTSVWRLQRDNGIWSINFIYAGQLLRICR